MGWFKNTIIVGAIASAATLYLVETRQISNKTFFTDSICHLISLSQGEPIDLSLRDCPLEDSYQIADLAWFVLMPTGFLASWILFWDLNNALGDKRRMAKLERQQERSVARWQSRLADIRRKQANIKHNLQVISDRQR